MAVLELTEGSWQKLPPLTDSQLRYLGELAQNVNREVLRRTRDSLGGQAISLDFHHKAIRFDGVAGYVTLGPLRVSVRPKFAGPDDFAESLARLALLDGRGIVRRMIVPPHSAPALAATGLADPVALYYAQVLTRALEQGPLLLSKRQSEFGTRMRGRLLVTKQVSSAPHSFHRLHYSYSKLDHANQATELLRWGCERFLGLARHPVAKARLRHALELLPRAADSSLPTSIARILALPMSAPFRPALRIAHELHRRRIWQHPDSHGGHESWAYLVVTHVAFEQLVSASYHLAARPLNLSHQAQRPAVLARAALRAHGQAREKVIRLDDALVTRGKKVLIASESKYSIGATLGNSKSRDHFNQILAACVATGSTRGLIVYPGLPSKSGAGPPWITDSTNLLSSIQIATVSLEMKALKNRNFRWEFANQLRLAVTALQANLEDRDQLSLL